jgi:FkbM family methyltransferase
MGIRNLIRLPLRVYRKLRRILIPGMPPVSENQFLTPEEFQRISQMPRYMPGETILYGKPFRFGDAPTFLSSLDEVFRDEIYKFIPGNSSPIILDCGANIGLASMYFKKNFPGANIIAYEPDPALCEIMQYNLHSAGYDDITVRNEAVSNKEELIYFHLEGGHSGMIVPEGTAHKIARVKAIRLKEVMEEFDEITFLKIDIEGHEEEVMPDIANALHKVRFLFLEYHSMLNKPQRLDEFLGYIRNAGLRYYMREAYQKPFPFVNREIFLGMDFLVNIFCYRE